MWHNSQVVLISEFCHRNLAVFVISNNTERKILILLTFIESLKNVLVNMIVIFNVTAVFATR